MPQYSFVLQLSFALIAIATVYGFYLATARHKIFLLITALWMALTAGVASTGFYLSGNGMPPRFLLLVAPPLAAILLLFVTRSGRAFMAGADIRRLTLLHTIRIPVEFVLFGLFFAKGIPVIMTFEGRNFDIISGMGALLVYFAVFVNKASVRWLLVYNIVSLLLLLNIVGIAMLSLRSPIQRFGFDQPNVAIGYFPFCWLPAVVVPLVLLSHLIAFRQLGGMLKGREKAGLTTISK